MKNSEKQREAVRKANFKRWANPENHVKASKKAKEIWQDPELLARQSIIVKKGHEERSPEDEAKRVVSGKHGETIESRDYKVLNPFIIKTIYKIAGLYWLFSETFYFLFKYLLS